MFKEKSHNSFENYFSEVQCYELPYGYTVNAKNEREAIDKIVEYLDWDWEEQAFERLKREIRENLEINFVRWQGWLDDDGYFSNCWVITKDKMWGVPRYKRVFSSNFDRHYVSYGHRFEPKADEPGNRVNYSMNRCDVCDTINSLESEIERLKND